VFTEELAALSDEQIADIRLVASERTQDLIRNAAADDEQYNQLKRQITVGWPLKSNDLPFDLQEFLPFADELVVCNYMIYKGQRLYVPVTARTYRPILDRIHSSHIGINGCLRRACEAVFWPGMTKSIQLVVARCAVCEQYQNSVQKETLLSHPIPKLSWEKVGIDIFCFHGMSYLVTVDYFSNYFEVDRLISKQICDVVYCLKVRFARHGIPSVVYGDNAFNKRIKYTFISEYIYQIFLTLDPTQSDPHKTDNFVTQPDPTRPVDGSDLCPTLI